MQNNSQAILGELNALFVMEVNYYWLFGRFGSKDKIRLLALPDFFGNLFRKSKISLNGAQLGDGSPETSRLSIHAYKALINLANAGLFHFLDVDKWIDSVD